MDADSVKTEETEFMYEYYLGIYTYYYIHGHQKQQQQRKPKKNHALLIGLISLAQMKSIKKNITY